MYKKIKIGSAIIWSILTFISHFMYDWFPNNIVASFFPINESIWEHMKLFVTPAIIVFALEMVYMKKKRVCIQNNYLALLIEIMSSIGFFLAIFLPYYYRFQHNFLVTIIMMFISIGVGKYLGYIVASEKNELIVNILAIPIILMVVVLNIVFTFDPPNSALFIDSTKNSNYVAIFSMQRKILLREYWLLFQ